MNLNEVSPDLRRERLNYLRFRVRVIGTSVLFIHLMRRNIVKSDNLKMRNMELSLSMDSVYEVVTVKTSFEKKIWATWTPFLSLCLWFTIYTTPAIMLYPDLNQSLYKWLFVNELVWIIDMIRMLVFSKKKGMDRYTAAMKYIKGALIIDLIATMP